MTDLDVFFIYVCYILFTSWFTKWGHRQFRNSDLQIDVHLLNSYFLILQKLIWFVIFLLGKCDFSVQYYMCIYVFGIGFVPFICPGRTFLPPQPSSRGVHDGETRTVYSCGRQLAMVCLFSLHLSMSSPSYSNTSFGWHQSTQSLLQSVGEASLLPGSHIEHGALSPNQVVHQFATLRRLMGHVGAQFRNN